MSQCVPSWDLDDNSAPSKIKYQPNSPQDVPSLDYEVAELTWENGQLSMHGLGVPRVFNKPTASSSPATWDKPRAGGTLESIVDQATLHHLPPKPGASKELAPWFDPHQHRAMVNPGSAAASVTVIMDALVPCNNGGRRHESRDGSAQVLDSVPAIGASRAAGCSTRVGSCSGAAAPVECGRRVVRVGVSSCRTSGSVSESATCGGRDSRQTMSIDTWERELGGPGFTSTSPISPENTISGQEYTRASADDRDSVSLHSMSQVYDRKAAGEEEGRRRENGKSSVCTKRSRAAAIHNQSERKRRDKINQRMKTLQKLVPNSSKSDKASMLDEVIEYLKQLQAQVHMMSRMNMPSMMLPLAMQQQMQMSMMGMSMRMGMGMGMGVMDIPRTPAVPLFMPVAAAAGWDNGGDCLTPPPPPASVMPDPLAALLGCQSQPMTMEAYSRMAAMYQQLQQQPGSKN